MPFKIDQREMEWNAEVTKIHHTNYVRNSRAITVAWFIFSACYTILNIVAFIQPFWFGDTTESPGVGYFGLYERCERVQGSDYKCDGDFLDFNTILNDYFRASSFLVGGAALLFIFSIICMLLFLFLKPRIVLKLCGILQFIAALFMAVGCIIYPNAYDDDDVRRICGQDATAYNMDKCRIRWAYILAIVLIFDALILAILAFVLAARQAKMMPEFKKLKEEKSPITNGFSGTFQQPPSVRQQDVRQRHNYTTLQNTTRMEDNFTNLETAAVQNAEPLVIPADSLRDSSSNSNPSSTRSNDGSSSVRSRRSQGSRSPMTEDRISQRSGGQVESPRSDQSESQEFGVSPRSETSGESDINFETDFVNPDDIRL